MSHHKLMLIGAVAVLLFFLVAPTTARADTVVIHFDELTPRPADGVSLLGVTFGFTVSGSPSSDAIFNAFGPGVMTFVQCPCLEGNGFGVLTMSFAAPSTILSFGLARSSIGSVNPGGTIELFDAANNSLGVFQIPTIAPPSPFAEGPFSYSGTAFNRAVLSFPAPIFRFAIDNLTFNTPAAVPEPASLSLLGIGLAATLGIVRRRRQRR